MATAPLPPRGLIDTPILIVYREGLPDAEQFITGVQAVGLPELSQISALALFAWCRDAGDVTAVRIFLSIATVHAVTANTMRRALRILASHAPPIPLTADNAIIAATAIEQSLPLWTLDPARFAAVPGLAAIQPY